MIQYRNTLLEFVLLGGLLRDFGQLLRQGSDHVVNLNVVLCAWELSSQARLLPIGLELEAQA